MKSQKKSEVEELFAKIKQDKQELQDLCDRIAEKLELIVDKLCEGLDSQHEKIAKLEKLLKMFSKPQLAEEIKAEKDLVEEQLLAKLNNLKLIYRESGQSLSELRTQLNPIEKQLDEFSSKFCLNANADDEW